MILLIFARLSRLMVIHLKNKVLALMDNKNNTKVICYLDGGDVCGFVFIVFVSVGVGGGESGRFHLVDHLTDRMLIPLPFQPPPPKTFVDCCVVEVGNLAVRSNSTAQRQKGLCYLPPLTQKNRPKSPQKV